ncbi:MAG: hypothetical protein ABI707_09900 [Ferruginibacter sp.]
MKSVAAFILLVALLTQLGNRYMMLLSYEVNKNLIAKTLCVNRDKPMNGCNGKCYLKKQLDKAAKEDGATNSNTRNNRDEVLFAEEAKKISTHFFAEKNSRPYINSNPSFTLQSGHGSIFHPPQAA